MLAATYAVSMARHSIRNPLHLSPKHLTVTVLIYFQYEAVFFICQSDTAKTFDMTLANLEIVLKLSAISTIRTLAILLIVTHSHSLLSAGTSEVFRLDTD